MMSKPVKITVWTAVLIGASAVLWLVFRPAAVPCDIESVKRGTLTVTVDEDGRTRLKERYIVSAPLLGYAGRTRAVGRPGRGWYNEPGADCTARANASG